MNVYINNPTDNQRHEMLTKLLKDVGRLEDYKNIINLLKPPKDIGELKNSSNLKNLKIGIIGAGLAGLSSAFELRKTGANITIFEANKSRIGGRVYTHYFDEEKHIYGELGPMRIPISHETTWYYINKFKLNTTQFTYSNPNAIIYVHNTRALNNDFSIKKYLYPLYNLKQAEQKMCWSDLITYTQLPMLKFTPEEREQFLKSLPCYLPKYEKILNLNLRKIYELLGLSNEAINMITSIDALQRGFLYSDYTETLQDLYTADFGILYQITGGMGKLPLAFYNSLNSNNPTEYLNLKEGLGKITFKQGAYVNVIYQNEDHIKLKYQYNDEDYYQEFDYVICTIPLTSLRTIKVIPDFSNLKMQAIREVNYINSTRAVFLCKERFWENLNILNGGISYTDSSLQTIVYPSYNKIYKDIGILVAAYSIGNDAIRLGNMTKLDRFNYIKRELERIHKLPANYLDEIIIDYAIINWNSEPYIKAAFTNFYPQQKKLFAYTLTKPEYNNRLFLAGEHVNSKHGWMQSALYSGKEVANKIVYYNNLKDAK